MPKILAKGGKPVAGVSSTEKARQITQKARAAFEMKEDGYHSFVVEKDEGMNGTDYIVSVRTPSGHCLKAVIPSHFLTKRGKLADSEMGRPGATVIVVSKRALRERESYEHSVSIKRTCIETEYIVEGTL